MPAWGIDDPQFFQITSAQESVLIDIAYEGGLIENPKPSQMRSIRVLERHGCLYVDSFTDRTQPNKTPDCLVHLTTLGWKVAWACHQ